MATTTAVSPAAPEPQPQMSAISRMFGVLFSPQKTFEDIVRKPSWIVPMLVADDSQHCGELWLEPANELAGIHEPANRKEPAGRTIVAPSRRSSGSRLAPSLLRISTYVFGTLGPILAALIFASGDVGSYTACLAERARISARPWRSRRTLS